MGIKVDTVEEGLVEDLARTSAGEAIEFAGLSEEVEQDLDRFSARVSFGGFGVGELFAKPFSFVPDLAEPLADFLLRQSGSPARNVLNNPRV